MKRSSVVLMLAFCSSCSAPSIALSDMPGETAKAVCTKYYECCMASELMGNQQFGPDQLGCEIKLKNGFDAQKTAAMTSETKMRATYHGDKLAECLAAYKKLTCSELKKNADTMIASCNGVFEPKIGLGMACTQSNECVSGSCQGATMTADGTCAAKVAMGSSCNGADCAMGAYCRPGDQTCQALKADGQACATNFECSSAGCNGKNPDGGMPNMGTCGEKGGPGTNCYATDGCSAAGSAPVIAVALAALTMARRRRRLDIG